MYVRVSTRGMFLAICPHRDTCRLATRKCRHVHFKQREMLSMSSSPDLAWHPISLSLSLSLSTVPEIFKAMAGADHKADGARTLESQWE